MQPLASQQLRDLDHWAVTAWEVPGVVLMENAGRGAAELLLALGVRGKVVVCCGKGNNGGDGFVLARHLHLAQVPVRVVFFGQAEELRGEAAVNFRIVCRLGLDVWNLPELAGREGELFHELAQADWIVDALVGTGLRGPVRPPLDRVIELINAVHGQVLAVDIPSGLDADTGKPLGPTIRATHTATFAAWKTGFLHPEAAQWTGVVHLLHIGVPAVVPPAGPQT